MISFRPGLNWLAAFVLATGAGGCASLSDARAQLAAKPLCCSDFTAASYAPVTLGQRAEFEFSPASPVMVVDGERAFIAGVALPEGARGLAIQAPSGGFVPLASYVDVGLVFLDAGKHQIEIRSALTLREDKRSTFPGLVEWYFGTELTLPAETRYVMLFSVANSTRQQYTHAVNGPAKPIPPSPIGPVGVIAL